MSAMFSFDTSIIAVPNNAAELTFGRRIAYVIENSGLSKAWVAERLGISKQALNYLLKGAIKPKFIDELAEILMLNPDWIEKGIGTPWSNKKSQVIYSQQQIPLLTKKDILKNPTGSWENNATIDFGDAHLEEDFIAYKLEDDSNFPPFIRNSILIFNIDKQPQNNDYVLLLIENDIFVRQFLVDGNNICYKSSDPGYKTFINSDAKLLGVLIEARYQVN